MKCLPAHPSSITRHTIAVASSALLLAGISFAQSADNSTTLPVKQMEAILRSQGTVSNGVLSVEQDRTDLHATIKGVPAKPSWQLNNSLNFQATKNDDAFFNGDFLVTDEETQPAIDAITRSKLLRIEAFHQHFYDLKPEYHFIHFRGYGEPLELAREVGRVIATTHTPLPQMPPAHPTSPLDAERLANILHGTAQVGSDGVVTVFIARKNMVMIDGVIVKPETNIATNVAFEPLGGDQAAVASDYSQTADEVNNVLRRGGYLGWDVGCLYNQETDENPQLYFSHQFKVGNAYELAEQVRQVLNLTNSE